MKSFEDYRPKYHQEISKVVSVSELLVIYITSGSGGGYKFTK